MKFPRVVITGIGPIASTGIGVDSFWCGARDKKLGIVKKRFLLNKGRSEEYFIHEVADFNFKNFNFEKSTIDSLVNWRKGLSNRDLFLTLASIKLAILDSNFNLRKNTDTTSLIISHENPGLEDLLFGGYRYASSIKKNPSRLSFEHYYKKNVKAAFETQPFMLLYHVARIFDLHKYSLYINNACASGLFCFEAAADLIRLGKAKAVIISAADAPTIFKYLWFENLKMYSKDGINRPFSSISNGFIMGEGAVSFILENYDTAIKRKAKIYAEYLGGDFGLEGWKVTMPNIIDNSLAKIIDMAIKNVKLKSKEIDLVCAHGVGTRITDFYESTAIKKVFKNRKDIPVVAFKPYFGHSLGVSSMIESALLLISLHRNFILPTLNVDEGSSMGLNILKTPLLKSFTVALKTCCAFAGNNAAVLFKKVEQK